MPDARDPLLRIAEALERLAGQPRAPVDWVASPAYLWRQAGAFAIPVLEALPLELLIGIDAQKASVAANIARLAQGLPAHDMLLWGARGMGKSALVRAAVSDAQHRFGSASLALVQIASGEEAHLPSLFAELAHIERSFLLFIDDLGFDERDGTGPRQLRSWLEGGVAARPGNVRLAVTSNRRAIVPRHAAEQDDPLNPRDAVDDRLALADRFGLSLGFHNCDQQTYLAIVATYADSRGLAWDESEALEWAKRRGARSGRTAWQFITEIAGRSGKPL